MDVPVIKPPDILFLCMYLLPKDFKYQMKIDSRVRGPWKDDQFLKEDEPELTRQLIEFYTHEMWSARHARN